MARALLHFGATPVVTGCAGGMAGQFIEADLRVEGRATDLVRSGLESRTCNSILDKNFQALTEIYEKGQPMPFDRVEEMLDRFLHMFGHYETVTLSGSLLPGMSSEYLRPAHPPGPGAAVPVLLDSGPPLREGVAAKPTLMKPNENEVAAPTRRPLATFAELAEAAGEIAHGYGTIVALSLGHEGAILADGAEAYRVQDGPLDA